MSTWYCMVEGQGGGFHCDIARSLGEGLVSGRRPNYKFVWAAQSQLFAWFDGCNALL